MSTPSWVEDSTSWSTVKLAGKALPGCAKVTGEGGTDLDVPKAKGNDGARVRDNGYTPAELTMVCQFTDKHFGPLMEILIPLARPTGGKKRMPVTIEHARTSVLGIHSVYVGKISTPDIDSLGIGSIQVGLVEWIPEPKKVKRAASNRATSTVERDPFAPGSLISLPGPSQEIRDIYAPNEFLSDEENAARKAWLDSIQNGV
ncbi:MAG TPA: hypothetical protein VHE30_25975 [Polyangiaceae bacterium]|nr:hypothetical protein [Polyangiaceae bacterium]